MRRCGHSKLSKMAAAPILNLFESKIALLDPLSPKTPPYNQTWSGSDNLLRRYGHWKFFQDGGGRHLEFVRTGNSAIRSGVHKNPTLERNMKWIRRPVAEILPLEIFPSGGGRRLGFVRTLNSAVRSAVPKTLPYNQTWSGSDHLLRRYGHSRILGAYGTPFWGEGEVVVGQRWHHSKERWWFPIGSPLWLLRYL